MATPAPVGSATASAALPAGLTTSTAAASKDIPRDARLIGLILASLGATDAEPGVVAMLLEFAHRYSLEILQSSQVYAEHAARGRENPAAITPSGQAVIELDDVRLAVASKLEHSYTSPLPKEFLLPLAAQINRVPLPTLPESYGIRLPPLRERLTAPTWDLLPVKERRTYAELQGQGGPSKPNGVATNGDTDMEVARGDLFGGQDDDDDEDSDDEMEEVLDPGLQGGQNAGEDNDGEDAEDDDDDDDAEGDDGDDDAGGREEDDDYDG